MRDRSLSAIGFGNCEAKCGIDYVEVLESQGRNGTLGSRKGNTILGH